MSPQLTVHNAEIRTATVEIKTLTVSGKQVTLALYRQLPERRLMADDGTLNGVPWGTVNYHPGKCDWHIHLHVIWQRGTELLRSAVQKPTDLGDIYLESLGEEWLDAALLDGWLPNGGRRDSLRVTFGEGTASIEPDGAAKDAIWPNVYYVPTGSTEDEEKDKHRQEALTKIRERSNRSRAELQAEVEAEVAAVLAERMRRADSWKALCDLPQLFIAV